MTWMFFFSTLFQELLLSFFCFLLNFFFDGNLKFYLSCLKKKLANGSDSDFDLLNQRGIGFRFVMQ